MSIVPARPPSKLDATEKLIAPLPVPLAFELIVRKPEVVEAVHEQLAGMLIAKPPLPPVIGNDCTVGERVNAHAVVEVCRLIFQLPAILPEFEPLSSTANNFQTPFGALPKKAASVVPVNAPCGAGAGNTSPGAKSVGLNVPDES